MRVITFSTLTRDNDTMKFITGTRTEMNDQHEYGYLYFSAVLVCIVLFGMGTHTLSRAFKRMMMIG